MKKVIDIHVVDDVNVEIEGHQVVFDLSDEFRVVNISRNGLEAVKWEEKNNSDVMIVDLCMPIFDGIEVMKYVSKHKMDTNVLMYSGIVTSGILNDLIQMGIKSYVLKSESIEDQFLPAIREVSNGGVYFSEYTKLVLNEEVPEIKPIQKIDISEKVLSKQESQVLGLMLNDDNMDIEEGELKQKTITDVMRRVRDKYNVANNVALVKKLFKR